MKHTTFRPSIFRIIWLDSTIFALLFIVFLPSLILMLGLNINSLAPPSIDSSWFIDYISLGALIIGTAKAVIRVKQVQKIFAEGIETPGTVISSKWYKAQNIKFEYTFIKKYQTNDILTLSTRGYYLKPGTHMIVVVQESNPEHAVIRDLYISNADFLALYKDMDEFAYKFSTIKYTTLQQPVIDNRSYIDKLRNHSR